MRGATGLMTGAGSPAASVNLVRKHADSRESRLQFSATAGSWNDRRVEVDVSMPLTSDGSVRARVRRRLSGSQFVPGLCTTTKRPFSTACRRRSQLEHACLAGLRLPGQRPAQQHLGLLSALPRRRHAGRLAALGEHGHGLELLESPQENRLRRDQPCVRGRLDTALIAHVAPVRRKSRAVLCVRLPGSANRRGARAIRLSQSGGHHREGARSLRDRPLRALRPPSRAGRRLQRFEGAEQRQGVRAGRARRHR